MQNVYIDQMINELDNDKRSPEEIYEKIVNKIKIISEDKIASICTDSHALKFGGTYMQNDLLPSTGFVRLSTILKIIPVSKSTWWLGVKTGRFPKAIKFSSNVTVWRAEDIAELIRCGTEN